MEPQQQQQTTQKVIVEAPPIVPTTLGQQIFENGLILENIISNLGNQYLFIASVNRSFHNTYTTLFEEKETCLDGSTMKSLEFCYDENLSDYHTDHLIQSALCNGNVEGLSYLQSNRCSRVPFCSCSMIEQIIKNEYLHVLQWLHMTASIVNWRYVITCAAKHCTNITILKWLYTKHTTMFMYYGVTTLCKYAAINGHIEILQWAYKVGCPWYIDTCFIAAKYGQLDVLQWARMNGCPCDESVCQYAAKKGYLELLQCARTNNCPWDKETCRVAAEYGHLHVLQYAHEHDCPWDSSTCSSAAQKGRLHVLQYAHEHGCPWDSSTCSSAAQKGHLHVLQYAHKHGCPWDGRTCSIAAKYGHLKILKWARLNGCPWNVRVCSSAAQFGHFDVLIWAREHGCPWNRQTYLLARDVKIKEWLKINGCPME